MGRIIYILVVPILLASCVAAPALSDTVRADGQVAERLESFSASAWQNAYNDADKKFKLLAAFLRQYDLIGMDQSRVAQLLGNERSDLRLSNSCVGAVWMEIEYENGKVSRWRMRDWDGCDGIHHHEQPWIADNVLLILNEPVYPAKFTTKYTNAPSLQIAEHEQTRR